MNLKELFKRKKKEKDWSLAEGHVVVPAFIDRGVQYYEIKDLFNTGIQENTLSYTQAIRINKCTSRG